MQSGNKALAMRELRRAKTIEKQALSTQSALDAVEAQSDMLEQTALQREVAAALGATAKSLKKDKGLLSKAEDAVDAAAEMRDMHDDLSTIMAGLDTAPNDIDDEELMTELQSMLTDNNKDGDVEDTEAQTRESVAKARMELEKKHEDYDEMERLRRGLPETPKLLPKGLQQPAREKQALLAQ